MNDYQKNKKLLIIVQARYDSRRFKGKVLKIINNKSILEIIIRRIKRSKFCKNLVVATTKKKNDLKIVNLCKKINVDFFQGDEKNVLKRFYSIAKKYKARNIVRITADCPMIDFKLMDKVIKKFFSLKIDYLSNTLVPTFPDGLDIEIFRFSALRQAYFHAKSEYDKEHVTPYLKRNLSIKKFNFRNKKDLSNMRLTLDYREDLKIIKKIFNNFNPNIYFCLNKIIDLYKKNKFLFKYKSNTKKKYFKREKFHKSYDRS